MVAGEPCRIIIVANGRKLVTATVDDSIERSIAKSRVGSVKTAATAAIRQVPGTDGLAELTINRSDTGPVAWTVSFEDK